jgi:DNA-binding Lrp family transcriptional regulator
MKLTKSHIDILRVIQRDATATLEQVAAAAGVSHTTLWRRLKELEANDVIRGRVTILNPEKTGHTVCAFVYVNIVSHETKHRDAFEKLVDDTPAIMQCFSITGPNDYILTIRVRDIKDYELLLMDKILSHPSVASASSNIALREHKFTTELHL